MISRLLVANRGEIARRVILACRQHGVSPAAVYSDADADAAFVSEADVAVRLPGVSPTDTYLRIDSVVAAAVGLWGRRGASGVRIPLRERRVRPRGAGRRPDLGGAEPGEH